MLGGGYSNLQQRKNSAGCNLVSTFCSSEIRETTGRSLAELLMGAQSSGGAFYSINRRDVVTQKLGSSLCLLEAGRACGTFYEFRKMDTWGLSYQNPCHSQERLFKKSNKLQKGDLACCWGDSEIQILQCWNKR